MNDRLHGRYSERQIRTAARRLGTMPALRFVRALLESAMRVELSDGRIVYRWEPLEWRKELKAIGDTLKASDDGNNDCDDV